MKFLIRLFLQTLLQSEQRSCKNGTGRLSYLFLLLRMESKWSANISWHNYTSRADTYKELEYAHAYIFILSFSVQVQICWREYEVWNANARAPLFGRHSDVRTWMIAHSGCFNMISICRVNGLPTPPLRCNPSGWHNAQYPTNTRFHHDRSVVLQSSCEMLPLGNTYLLSDI